MKNFLKIFTVKFKNLSLQWKINLIGIFVIFLFTLIVYILILPNLEKEKIDERKGKLKAVVNSAVSLMDHYEREMRLNFYGHKESNFKKTEPRFNDPENIEEAKYLIIKTLREMRYDKTEYFFILDGNGNMVMHPLKPELEGRNMMDVMDRNGVRLFREMVINSQRDSEAFVSYIWQSKYSPEIFEPQITYARYYWPWDWVVCSGLYTQDIQDSMRALWFRSAMYVAGTAVVTLVFLILIVYVSLSRPLKKLLLGIKEIHNGNLDHRISVSSQDEIGFLSNEFNLMISDLKSSRDSIIKSEKNYRELTDMLPDVIYETDINFNITYFNKAGYFQTGYCESDIKKGLPLSRLLEKDDFERIYSFAKKEEINLESKIFTTHKIFKMDSGYFYGENSTVVIFDNSGKLSGLRGIIRDVTEKRKLEASLAQSQKMETIGTLAGGLAHDFNNIMGGITGTLSIFKYEINVENKLDVNEIRKYIETMEESSQRATDMVQQLLALAHKHETANAPVDLSLTVKHVKKICSNTFDKSIEIVADIPESRIMVYSDPTQIEQVLLNLCINACHAMTLMREENEPKGGKLTITIRRINADKHFLVSHPEAQETEYWMLSVCDSGVGIEQKNISKIFVPFFTTKERGKGTGLGLSMVYNTIHQNNGFIDVYSEPGIGTTVNVFLPVLNKDNYETENKKEFALPMGKGLVLVVDDEEIMRKTSRSILEKCGYEVIEATDGVKGAELFRERHNEIKAVIIDLVMPKMSGEQAYLEMKKIDPNVKSLLASGFRQDERVNLALSYGINGFIQKPFTLEILSKAMHDLLYGLEGSC